MTVGNTYGASYNSTNPFSTNSISSGNTSTSQFDQLLSQGGLASPYSINQQNINGISMPPQTSSMLTEGGNILAQQLMNKFSPNDTYGYGSDSFRTSSLFGNGSLGTGVGMFDVLGSIAANTLPYMPIEGKFGFLVQSVPQIFQIVSGSMAGLQAWKEASQMKSVENKMGQNTWNEIRSDEENYGVTLNPNGLA